MGNIGQQAGHYEVLAGTRDPGLRATMPEPGDPVPMPSPEPIPDPVGPGPEPVPSPPSEAAR